MKLFYTELASLIYIYSLFWLKPFHCDDDDDKERWLDSWRMLVKLTIFLLQILVHVVMDATPMLRVLNYFKIKMHFESFDGVINLY